MREIMRIQIGFSKIHKDCLKNGIKPGIFQINAVAVEYERRFNFVLSGLKIDDSNFNQIISAFLPYPVIRLGKFPRVLALASKREIPKLDELIALVRAYETHDTEKYHTIEAFLMKKTGIKTTQDLMKAILIWLLLFSVIKNLMEGRCFTALSYELSGGEWNSIDKRFIRDSFKEPHCHTRQEYEVLSTRIWQTAARACMPFNLNPGFPQYLTTLIPHLGKEEFAGAAALAFLELDKTQRDENFKIDILLAGQLKNFCKDYALGKGVLGKLNRTGNKPGKTAKRYLFDCAYGKAMPSGIAYKDALYFFAEGAVLEALHIQKTFKLSENVCAIFCLFCFQHLPLFNLHTDLKYTKQSKLWPKFTPEGEEASFTVTSLSFIHFIKQALRNQGPINYKAWAKAGFPKDLSSFNSLDVFKAEVLGHEQTLAMCSKAFLVNHPGKNDLHVR